MTNAVAKPHSQTRITRWGDRLGRWNPQLLRHLRGTLSVKSTLFAIALSLVLQLLMGLTMFTQVNDLLLPRDRDQLQENPATLEDLDRCLEQGRQEVGRELEAALRKCVTDHLPGADPIISAYIYDLKRDHYCTGNPRPVRRGNFPLCIPNANGTAYEVDWGKLYGDDLPFIRGFVLTVLALSGAYAIAQNWLREVKLGTLDFIRMSPEPAGRILLGKLLGAPILCFIGALAWVPFHLYIAVNSDFAFVDWFASDMFGLAALVTTLVGAMTACVLTGGLNLSVLSLTLLPMVAGAWLLGSVEFAAQEYPRGLEWFGMNLLEPPVVGLVLGTGVAIALTLLLWQSACRRFDNPHATPLSRRQAYQLMVGFNALAIGAGWPIVADTDFIKGGRITDLWTPIGFVWLLLQVLTVWATLPQRQQLLDWTRYRHMYRDRHHSLSQWLWHDNAPCMAVPVVNLGITWIFWSPWALTLYFSHGLWDGLVLLAGLMIPTAMVVLWTAIATWCLLKITHNPRGWLMKLVFVYGLASFVAFIYFLSLFAQQGHQFWWPILITAVGAPMLPTAVFSLNTLSSLAMAGLVMMVGTGTAVAIAQRTLNKVGESESQALINASSIPPSLS